MPQLEFRRMFGAFWAGLVKGFVPRRRLMQGCGWPGTRWTPYVGRQGCLAACFAFVLNAISIYL